MTDFDITTSYLADYGLVDFVADAVLETPNGTEIPDTQDGLHAKRGDLSTSEFLSLAAGLALSSSAAAFVVWPPIDPVTYEAVELNIVQGSVLRFSIDNDESEETEGEIEAGEGWVIQAHDWSRFGHYTMICDREKTNAAT